MERVLRFLSQQRLFVALAGVLLVFFIFKLYSLNFVLGDEHMYNYMSLLILEGKWPYRDFFFSHPPLQLYVVALLFGVTGYSLVAAKLIPTIAALVSALHIFLIGKKLLGKSEALLAAVLFLFTFDVMRGSAHLTGANMALAFMMAGAYQVIVKRVVLGGVLLAFGALTGLYAVPLALMLIVLLALRSRRESLKLLAAWAGTLALGALIFVGVAGGDALYAVVEYNMAKKAMTYSWFQKYRNVFFLNTTVMIGLLPAMAWAAVRWKVGGRELAKEEKATLKKGSRWKRAIVVVGLWRGDPIAAVILCATFVFGYYLFYSTLKVYYSYYFMLIMPFTALLTAYVTVDVFRFVWQIVRQRKTETPVEQPAQEERPRPSQKKRKKRKKKGGKKRDQKVSKPAASRVKAKASAPSRAKRQTRRSQTESQREPPDEGLWSKLWPVAVPLLVLLGVFLYRQGIKQERLEKYKDTRRSYTWRDGRYVPGLFNDLIKGVFWDPVRDRNSPPSTIARYLQHETVYAASIDKFVQAVRDNCKPGETVFGEYSLGPFAASVSDCTVAANLIDTNMHRVRAGESTLEQWIGRLKEAKLTYAVVRRGSSLTRRPELRKYLYGTFPEVVFTWKDPKVGMVEFRRRAE